MRGGSNLPRVADYNRVLIVDLVRRQPGISRVELSQRTGLTAQTVTNICAHLCQQGLIRDDGRVSIGGGRWRTVYRVVPSSRLAVGLHIDPARAELALVDLAGSVLDRSAVQMPLGDDPGMVLDAIAVATKRIVARNKVLPAALSGLGVASPGPLRKTAGAVVGPPNLPGWDVVRVRDELAGRLGMPVELEKDTVAAITGEQWAGHAPSADFVFVYLGTGTGAGVVLDGEVAHGSWGNLGNFGHIGGDPTGPRCECGNHGCTATSSPIRLVQRAEQRGVLTPLASHSAAAVESALGQLAALAAAGDLRAGDILDEAARSIGWVTAHIVNFLDLDAVVFGGPNWPYFSESVLRLVPDIVNKLHVFAQVHGVQVAASSLGTDVGPIGAASLVLANAVSARPAMLLAAIPPSDQPERDRSA